MKLGVQRSLKNVLLIFFVIFAVVPMTLMGSYALWMLHKTLNTETQQRLTDNVEAIEIYFDQLAGSFERHASELMKHEALSMAVMVKNGSILTKILEEQQFPAVVSDLVFRDDGGKVLAAVHRNDKTMEWRGNSRKQIYLKKQNTIESQEFSRPIREVVDEKGQPLKLAVVYPIYDGEKNVLGSIQYNLALCKKVLGQLKKRTASDLQVFDDHFQLHSATNEGLAKKFQTEELIKADTKKRFANVVHEEKSLGLLLKEMSWGDEKYYIGLGRSRMKAKEVLTGFRWASLTIGLGILMLLIIAASMTTKYLIRPLELLDEATQKVHESNDALNVPITQKNELGRLTKKFNEMSERIIEARREKLEKIEELKRMNEELENTQEQLVQSKKMASVGQLVAGVAHELNNPIGFIYSNMSFLEDYSEKLVGLVERAKEKGALSEQDIAEFDFEYVREDLPKLISSCSDGAERTKEIVLGLKNFSRQSNDKKIRRVDVNKELRTSLEILGCELKERIRVHQSLGSLPPLLCAAGSLSQVFTNILQNASQSISGMGEIWIQSAVVSGEEEDVIQVRIRDTGCGMSKATQERIFEPFYTTKDVGQGTGLGMSITYGIVKKYDGKIEIESEVGRGTEFIITIPIRQCCGDESHRTATSVTSVARSSSVMNH